MVWATYTVCPGHMLHAKGIPPTWAGLTPHPLKVAKTSRHSKVRPDIQLGWLWITDWKRDTLTPVNLPAYSGARSYHMTTVVLLAGAALGSRPKNEPYVDS